MSPSRSPQESTVIPSSTRSSRSHSHSHLPTSPITTTTTTTSSPRSLSVSLERHTYHHLRQHEGMQPLPLNYPEHEYANLGPRSNTPPPRPPKPQNFTTPHSASVGVGPPISATAPPWNKQDSTSQSSGGHIANHVDSSVQASPAVESHSPGSASSGVPLQDDKKDDGSDEFPRRSIYDTMPADSARGRLRTERQQQVASGVRERGNSHTVEGPVKQHDRGYDQLIVSSSSPPRKQRKASVTIFDDPDYSPPQERAEREGRRGGGGDITGDMSLPGSVRVVDPRYAGDYERHSEYVPPQVDIPREQLQEKYHGDYERDPTYFLTNPTRSLSVSASHVLSQHQRQRCSSLTSEPRLDKYRGDYERSEDYCIPRPFQNGDVGMEREQDYVLEPDRNYTGAYERHPDYVPPLVKRSSKSKIQILSRDGSDHTLHTERPSHLAHEYTSLAKATKDPPQQYTTLNSRLTTTCTMPNKDSRV